MHRTLVGLIVCAAAAMLALNRQPPVTPAHQQRITVTRAKAPTEAPIVFFYQSPSPGAPRQNGLVCAVWADGAVLCAANWSKPGENLELGTLATPVADLVAQLKGDGLTELPPSSFTVPDGPTMRMGVLGKGGAADGKDRMLVNTWDERILPNYGANMKPTEAYRAMVAGWYKTKVTLASLRIKDRHALSGEDAPSGVYRGYDTQSPFKTAWLEGEALPKK